MDVGIVGCGAIANIIVSNINADETDININYFFDNDLERAENLAHLAGGVAVLDIEDMIKNVDLVLECASPDCVREYAPKIISSGCNMIIMSIGALLDFDFYDKLLNLAHENNVKIHLPSGAVVGLDGIKAVSGGKIYEVNLVTRKSPKSLGKSINEVEILFEGKASDAVKKFPVNINVAATISLACKRDIDVKIILDPNVDRNVHEVNIKGDFGEFKTITRNHPCSANPKTSMLAAFSAIKLLKSLNDNILIGT